MTDDQIHWFSIINSLMIVLFLSGMVAMIMMRTLHRDISNYNQLETVEEAQEETGWKLVGSPSCCPSAIVLWANWTSTEQCMHTEFFCAPQSVKCCTILAVLITLT